MSEKKNLFIMFLRTHPEPTTGDEYSGFPKGARLPRHGSVGRVWLPRTSWVYRKFDRGLGIEPPWPTPEIGQVYGIGDAFPKGSFGCDIAFLAT